MRLVGFSVTKYRSLMAAHRLQLSDSTVLLGQNNEGKSNLLAALAAAMSVVSSLGMVRLAQGRVRVMPRQAAFFGRPEYYNWERDFPISLQDSQPDGESIFRLEFKLSDEERSDFRREVKSILNENLPIEIKIGKRDPAFKVIKKGPGADVLNSKAQQVANFIGRRVEFTYIPAVRNANAALEVVRSMVEKELRVLEQDEEYTKLVRQLIEAQKPVLLAISNQVGAALKEFLPQIQSVDIRANEDSRYRALRREIDIVVNDGTPTSLERKGDGVQSLAAISLLRGVNPSKRDVILALEEPESHLHPSAIHRLREVIDELSHKHQTVITTHCPLFVDRSSVESNIIVRGSKAVAAKSIAEIREVLGVRASDNLIHANWVLVVEGETDALALRSLLSERSPTLRSSLRNANLVIDHLAGAGKLSYKLTELAACLCGVHVFLDNDDSGRLAGERAIADNLLKHVDLHYATCPGKKYSEWEDLVRVEIYNNFVLSEYGVDLKSKHFQNAKQWNVRMSAVFHHSGKLWDEKIKGEIKAHIAKTIEGNPCGALIEYAGGAFDSLCEELEKKIARKS